MSGVLFTSSVLLPKRLQVAARIKWDGAFVEGVLEVARYEAKAAKHMGHLFEVGAFLIFMSKKDQQVHADFLRRRLSR